MSVALLLGALVTAMVAGTVGPAGAADPPDGLIGAPTAPHPAASADDVLQALRLADTGVTRAHERAARAERELRSANAAQQRVKAAHDTAASVEASTALVVAGARKARPGLTVYHELDPTLFSATSKTFVGQVYTALGLKNIADAADSAGFGYPQLSAEYVVSANPDLIVLADTVCCGQKASTVAARPGWDRINAIKTGSVVRVDDSIASRWGPRLVNFFRAMSSALARLRS